MSEHVHYINGEELYQTTGELRFAPVRHIFVAAFRGSIEQKKMMLDPMDILTALLDDPELDALWEAAGVGKANIESEIEKIEAGTPKGFTALRILSMANAVEDYRPGKYRSYTLDQAILLGMKIADDEGSFQITGHHLLAGMLRQGMNTASAVFRDLHLSERQLRILARLPMNAN